MADKQTATLTDDDLYTLRDALIHAERAHRNDADPTRAQQYGDLFRRIGMMLVQRKATR